MLTLFKIQFQRILWQSRIMIILPVIAGMFSALVMIIIGTYDVCEAVRHLPAMLTNNDTYHTVSSEVMMLIISSVDAYLIATVLLIFSIGLYELFISKINEKAAESSSKILIIHNLDQLKEKLAKVIIMVLIVTFFQQSLNFKYDNVIDLLYLGIGIFLISLAVYFTHKGKHDTEE